MTVISAPPGIPSPARLEKWLRQAMADELVELTDIQLIAGGRSNLTYRLAVRGPGGDRFLVLRRPPLGHVLPTAHDMSREYRVLSALAGTKVPVAQPVAFCDDAEVVGAPFYLMEHVSGAVLRSRQDTAVLTEPQAAGLSARLADMLAAIHGVDVEGRPRRARPRRWIPHASAGPLAAAVGTVQDQGGARVRRAGAAADGHAPARR
jgi:aminoglycoside phosphotransferase (APT) family kinase protein